MQKSQLSSLDPESLIELKQISEMTGISLQVLQKELATQERFISFGLFKNKVQKILDKQSVDE